jgi:ankyrin repeat protein
MQQIKVGNGCVMINNVIFFLKKERQTQLHVAATNGDLQKALQLLQDGISLNLRDKNGWTALHCAAYSRNKHIFSLLLEQENIDVFAKNESGSTPLHYFTRNFDATYYNEEQVEINFVKIIKIIF